MIEQEKINADVQQQLAMQDAKFSMFMQEMRDFKTEMRDRDNQRAAEIRELQQKHDADMKEIRQDMKTMQASLDAKIENIGYHVRNLSVAAIIGVGTIAITVIYSILTH